MQRPGADGGASGTGTRVLRRAGGDRGWARCGRGQVEASEPVTPRGGRARSAASPRGADDVGKGISAEGTAPEADGV